MLGVRLLSRRTTWLSPSVVSDLRIADRRARSPRVRTPCREQCGSRRIAFLRFVAHTQRFPDLCNTMLFPSMSAIGEGFGQGDDRSDGRGVPVTARAVGSLPESIANDHTGFLIAARYADALEDAILRLARDPAMARRGRYYVADEFSLDRPVERTLRVPLEALIADRTVWDRAP
jgi:glycosyltransferase involved in cell wall biosynthesis